MPRRSILSRQLAKSCPSFTCGAECFCWRFTILVASHQQGSHMTSAVFNGARAHGFFQKVRIREVLSGAVKCSASMRRQCKASSATALRLTGIRQTRIPTMPIQTPKPLIDLYGRAKSLIKKQWRSLNTGARRRDAKLRVSDLYPSARSQKPTDKDKQTKIWKSWLSGKVRRD